MDADPFSHFSILPHHGSRTAVVAFKLKPGEDGDLYFYRSPDGAANWEILNPDDPVRVADGEFLDTDLPDDSMLPMWHWRGMLEKADGTRLGGRPVGARESLPGMQYNIVRKMIRTEWEAMAGRNGSGKGSGVEVFHLIPLDHGPLSGKVDPETMQRFGPECPDDPADSFGEDYAYGYAKPVRTWVKILAMADQKEMDRPDSTGTDESADMIVRMLAFPQPRRGHLLVFPESDERYVLGPVTGRYFFRGIAPVAWKAEAIRLRGDDPRRRYRID